MDEQKLKRRPLKPLPNFIFMSRWLQVPLYLGLIAAQVIYVYQFGVELVHLVGGTFFSSGVKMTEADVMLLVLGLIDVVMISNLLVMVIVGGYETFVSRMHLDGHPDQPEWLSHVNAAVLKVKLAKLGRPRVDVTLRISGFFRDAFPDQIALFDQAVRAVGALNEPAADNPIAARMRAQQAAFVAQGATEIEAKTRAGYRVFGSKPGAYGAGLQALIDEGLWDSKADLGEAYLVWGSYAYGANADGKLARADFEKQLSGIEAIVQNQDNREHDLLDSDDYYQFEGGMAAAAEKLTGQRPTLYHNDHSRPERPVIRTLEEEIARVVRGRCANPKWISGVMRHGYKGAFEMAATVDYLFAFAATTGAVRDHHFAQVFDAYLGNDTVRQFIKDKNPDALREMALRFAEAINRGLWTPKSNSAQFLIADIAGQIYVELENAPNEAGTH